MGSVPITTKLINEIDFTILNIVFSCVSGNQDGLVLVFINILSLQTLHTVNTILLGRGHDTQCWVV